MKRSTRQRKLSETSGNEGGDKNADKTLQNSNNSKIPKLTKKAKNRGKEVSNDTKQDEINNDDGVDLSIQNDDPSECEDQVPKEAT